MRWPPGLTAPPASCSSTCATTGAPPPSSTPATAVSETSTATCGLSVRSQGGKGLVGVEVKASASRAADLGSIAAFAVDLLSRSSHTSDFKIGTPETTLSGSWRYRVGAKTGRSRVSVL